MGTNDRSRREIAMVAITTLALGACAGVNQNGEPAPAEQLSSLKQKLIGRWGWTRGQCESAPINVSFSDDGALMYHHSSQGLYLGEVLKERITYQIYDEGEQILRVIIEGEDRRTDDGLVVAWDLVLIDDSRFCWHRYDWEWPRCTKPLIRCNA
jgi:hypothetical protein